MGYIHGAISRLFKGQVIVMKHFLWSMAVTRTVGSAARLMSFHGIV